MQKTEYQIPAPLNRTIALVSDLHEFDPTEVLEILRQERPDVIAVAGDMLERYGGGENPQRGYVSARFTGMLIQAAELLAMALPREKQHRCREYAYRFFREACQIAPVVMSRGNHEGYLAPEDRAVLAEAGVTLLDNDWTSLEGILFGGLTSGHVTGTLDRGFLSRFSQQQSYKILLSHHPEYAPILAQYPVDLILSGHCHGGQIRIFGRVLFAPGQGFLPKYHHGVYNGRLVVSAGCANPAPIPRWGNPTEVVILRLGNGADVNME